MASLPTTTELEMPDIVNRETGEVVTLTDEQLAEKREETLVTWYHAVEEALTAKSIIENEQALRKEVASLFFLDPQEGTNTYDLPAGYKLKLTHKIDRKVDEAALEAVKVQLKEINISIDTLIKYEPKLETKTYKGLKQVNAEAAKVFEQALIVKPASPTLEVVAPKQKS
jgi:hypothetical protein